MFGIEILILDGIRFAPSTIKTKPFLLLSTHNSHHRIQSNEGSIQCALFSISDKIRAMVTMRMASKTKPKIQ